jgi:DGQHR domain-containing protein
LTTFRFNVVQASQASDNRVLSFAATPDEILSFSHIERIGRQDDGKLRGFQRHQIASHIKEIRDYLTRDDALLPNAVIIAFIKGRGVRVIDGDRPRIEITFGTDKPGFVVDGQQRLSALSGIKKPGFQVFVSALICKDYNQLRQQFVLINNTRPLPKALIYELLPNVVGLPERFTSRTLAARLVDRLNFRTDSSLCGEIRQHTNPTGVISDIAMQKLLMNSTSDGAIREFIKSEELDERAFSLVSEFFAAVKVVFGPEWVGMTPKTSRLRHGAGIVSMGCVMELLYAELGAKTKRQFVPGLELLKKHTAWTSGQWHLSDLDIRPWNGIQNTSTDIDLLANHLVRSLKRALRRHHG